MKNPMKYPVIDGVVAPEGHLEVLSRQEIAKLLDNSQTGLHQLFRNCALAVLASADYMDDGKALMEAYPNFDIRIVHRERGIKLELSNAPASAFVDGRMILGMREHLFAALRDILFTSTELALQDQRGAMIPRCCPHTLDLVIFTLRQHHLKLSPGYLYALNRRERRRLVM